LGRICDRIEQQLAWTQGDLGVIARKNRLLEYLTARDELVVFDHVAHVPPRSARFMAALTERVPVWIVCRSDRRDAIGHVWEYLYKFARIELRPFTRADIRSFLNAAVAKRAIQSELLAQTTRFHHLSRGNPRILQELLIELRARSYNITSSSGCKLLALDREIRKLQLCKKARLVLK
jgi:hypothetical protein